MNLQDLLSGLDSPIYSDEIGRKADGTIVWYGGKGRTPVAVGVPKGATQTPPCCPPHVDPDFVYWVYGP
jgi:hypothetical protein